MKALSELDLKKKKLIIFDMDGTLIDHSLDAWNLVDQELIQEYGHKFLTLEEIQAKRDEVLHNNNSGDIYLAYSEYLIREYNFPIKDAAALTILRRDKPNKILAEKVDFKPDVVPLIKRLKELNFLLALATLSTQTQIDIYSQKNKKMLSQMNITEAFNLIMTNVPKKKPDPEVYLKIMEEMQMQPEDCLVFEDSFTGVLAGKRAGIEVVNIYDPHADAERDKIDAITDYKIANYGEFIAYLDSISFDDYARTFKINQ